MGPTELLVIVALGLMLFSPKELPKVLRSVARFWGSVRRTADEFRDAIMQDEDLREPLEEMRKAYSGTRAELREAEEQARRAVAKARMEMRQAERKLAEVARQNEEPGAGGGSSLTGRIPASTGSAPGAGPTSSDDDPVGALDPTLGAVAVGRGSAPVVEADESPATRDGKAGLGAA